MIQTKLLKGDSLNRLKEFPEHFFDSVVTDPPYGLSFMGKKWDYEVPSVALWREVLRVLKPGGHLLSFAGTRTYHRMAVNIEDAGFEVRDMVSWIYGQGFPKSLDISKAFDKSAGAEREVVGEGPKLKPMNGGASGSERPDAVAVKITAPTTDLAKQWEGWGTALKPALEPICLARKPLIGTVVENVKEHGTGGLNIDGCRIPIEGHYGPMGKQSPNSKPVNSVGWGNGFHSQRPEGRWPSNVILDEEAGRVMDEQSGTLKSGALNLANITARNKTYGNRPKDLFGEYATSEGGASRFFYCAKVSGKERNSGCEEMGEKVRSEARPGSPDLSGKFPDHDGRVRAGNHHPTVKPVKLMEYLCKLVTPPGGVILDPFMGSGSTGIAALGSGFGFVGIERDEEYFAIAKGRMNGGVK